MEGSAFPFDVLGGGFPLVWVAGLEGPFVSFCLGWLCGGAADFFLVQVDGSSFFNFRYWFGGGRFSIGFGCLFGGAV